MTDGKHKSASDSAPSSGDSLLMAPEGKGSAKGDSSSPRRPRRIGWRSRDVMRAAALVIAMYLAVQLLWYANALILTVFMGVLFGLAVSSGVDRLERFRIRRGIGAALIVVTFFGVMGGFFALMAPTLREQGGELRQKLPVAIDKVENWFAKRQGGMMGMFMGGGAPQGADAKGADTKGAGAKGTDAKAPSDTGAAARDSGTADSARAASTEKFTADSTAARAAEKDAKTDEKPVSFRERIESMMSGASSFLFRFLSSTVAVFGGLLLIVFLSIYIAADPDMYQRGVLHLMPVKSRKRAKEVMSAVAKVLRKWLVTQLIAMAVIGGVTTVGLLLFKVKAAFALGFIAGLLEFIPTVGPLLSAIPAIAMGFLDSPEKAAGVAVMYIGIQFLENHILIPMLMKDGMDLPPALTIVAQALMALVFGFIGLLVAVPLAAASMVAIRMLYVHDVVGDPIPAGTSTGSGK